MNSIDKFAPTPTPESQPFWDELAAHRLVLPHCAACDSHFFPPMPGCPDCGAGEESLSFDAASGKGQVYSWVEAHYAFDPVFADDVPYTLLTVDLEEGVKINGRLLGSSLDDVHAGMTVQADFEDLDGFTRVAFRAVPAEDDA